MCCATVWIASTLATHASAGDLSFGAGFSPGSGGAISLDAGWTVARWQHESDHFRVAARADLSLIPGSGARPAIGGAVLLGVRQADSHELYFGSGLGLAGGGEPFPEASLAVYGFAGVAFQLHDAIYGTVEYHLTGTSVAQAFGVRLGLRWQQLSDHE